MSLNTIIGSNSDNSPQFSKIFGALNTKIERMTGEKRNVYETPITNYRALMPAKLFELTYALNAIAKNIQSGMNLIDTAERGYKEIYSKLNDAAALISNFIETDYSKKVNTITGLTDKLGEINNEITDILNNTIIGNVKLFDAAPSIINLRTISGADLTADYSIPQTFTFNGVNNTSNNLEAGEYEFQVGYDDSIIADISNVYGRPSSPSNTFILPAAYTALGYTASKFLAADNVGLLLITKSAPGANNILLSINLDTGQHYEIASGLSNSQKSFDISMFTDSSGDLSYSISYVSGGTIKVKKFEDTDKATEIFTNTMTTAFTSTGIAANARATVAGEYVIYQKSGDNKPYFFNINNPAGTDTKISDVAGNIFLNSWYDSETDKIYTGWKDPLTNKASIYEIDADTGTIQNIINSLPTGANSLDYVSISNGYAVVIESGNTDKYYLINLKPYDKLSSADIINNSGNLTPDKINISQETGNYNNLYRKIEDDYLTFRIIDESANQWEVISKKWGELGTVNSGTDFYLAVDNVTGEYSINTAVDNSNFLKINIDNDNYSLNDSFTLQIKEGLVERADFDNAVATTNTAHNLNYVSIDEFGGILFRRSNNNLFFTTGVVDFDNLADSSSITTGVDLTSAYAAIFTSNKPGMSVYTSNNKIYYLNANQIYKSEFSDFANKSTTINGIISNDVESNESVIMRNSAYTGAADSWFGVATKIEESATYINETISLIYVGGNNWDVYSGSQTNVKLGTIAMQESNSVTQSFTLTGADGGETSFTLELKGWHTISGLGLGDANANNVFMRGDTIKLNLSRTPYAQIDAGSGYGPKTYLVEGRDNIVSANSTGSAGAISLNWQNVKNNYLDNIRPGSYAFQVTDSDFSIYTSENLATTKLDMPNTLSFGSLGISNLSNDTIEAALLKYKNAQQIVLNKLNRLENDVELLEGISNSNSFRLSDMFESNFSINNFFEAQLRLDKIRENLTEPFQPLNFINIRAGVVDELFSYLDNDITPN